MCGIFAWAGKNINDFNKDKFDKLGLYNVERGKDSCGVSFDGEIYQGFGTTKLYFDFLTQNSIEPINFPVVIGHTRQASYGSVVNSHNVHPFGFGINKGGYEFIGCHNGTLYNEKDLAKKYDVETVEKSFSYGHAGQQITNFRNKIDSEILLEIIYKNKNYKVLSEYNGGAALVFTNTKKPNVIYCWKGASQNFTVKTEEERPLFYFIEHKNSLYISSLSSSLESIGGTKNIDIFTFEENTIYEITDGNIENAVKHKISRINASQKKETINYGFHKAYNYDDYEDIYAGSSHVDKYKKRQEECTKLFKDSQLNNDVKKLIESSVVPLNIHNESTTMMQNDYKGKSYFNKLRFWKNGHLLNGIYTFIKGYGYYLVAEESIEAAKITINQFVNLPFVEQSFHRNIEANLENPNVLKVIPFTDKNTAIQNLHFFIQGVKIETYADFIYTRNLFLNDIKTQRSIDYTKLSHVSTHPVCAVYSATKDNNNQNIIFRGNKVTDKFTILGAEKIYHIENGNLTKLYVNDFQKRMLFGDENLVIKTLDDLKKENDKKVVDKKIISQHFIDTFSEIDEDTLIEEIYERYKEEMLEIYCTIDDLYNEISCYENQDKKINDALQTLRILKDYLLIEENE